MSFFKGTALVMSFFILLCFSSTLHGQCIGDINMLSPVEQSTDVGLYSDITLETNMDIVPGAVEFNSPYCAMTTSTCVVTVMLLPRDVYLNVSEASWSLYAKSVTCLSTAPRQITIRPGLSGGLDYGTEYSLVIRQLQVSNNSVPCNDIINKDINFAFETLHEPSRLIQTSLDAGRGIGCGDNISAVFAGQLYTLSTPQGPVVELRRLLKSSSTTISIQTTSLSITTTIADDGQTVSIDPDVNLEPGEQYLLDINADYLTGESSNSVTIPFFTRPFATVRFSVASLVSTHSVSQGNLSFLVDAEYAAYFDESLEIWAPRQVGNLYLKEWQSNLASVNLSTSQMVSINSSCNGLMDISVKASYDLLNEDSFEVLHTSMGNVEVYNADSEILQSSSSIYNLQWDPFQDSQPIVFSATPHAGLEFDKWRCPTYPEFHNNTNPILQFRAQSPYNSYVKFYHVLKPIFRTAKTDCSEVTLTVEIQLASSKEESFTIDQVVAIPLVGTWAISGKQKITGTITKPRLQGQTTIIDLQAYLNPLHEDCFEYLAYVTDDDQKGGTLNDEPVLGSNFNVTFEYPTGQIDCDRRILVYLSRKSYFVDVTLQMDDLTPLPWPHNISIQRAVGPDDEDDDDENDEYKPPTIARQGDQIQRVTRHYRYYCGEQAMFTQSLNKTNTGLAYDWGAWNCNAPYDCPPQTANDPDIIEFVVDKHYNLLYEFTGSFRITQIGFHHIDCRDEITWKNMHGSENVWQDDGQAIVAMTADIAGAPPRDFPNHYDGFHRTYPKLYFKFSEPVDETTVDPTSLLVRDKSEGESRRDGKTNVDYSTAIGDNTSLLNTGEEIELHLRKGTETYCCHMNYLKIFVNDKVESQNGERLSNPIKYGRVLRTEMPGLKVYFEKFRLGNMQALSENCRPPCFPVWSCLHPDVVLFGVRAHLQTSEILGKNVDYNNPDLRFPSGKSWKDLTSLTTQSVDANVADIARLSQTSVIQHGWVYMDRGNKELDDKYGEILDKTVSKINDHLFDALNVKAFGSADLAKTLGETVIKLATKSVLKCKDRNMKEIPISHYYHNFWHTNKLYEGNKKVFGQNGRKIHSTFHFILGDNVN